MSRFQYWMTCPYCGHRNKSWMEVESMTSFKEIITCNSEDGGCDHDFVAEVKLDYKVQTFELSNPRMEK